MPWGTFPLASSPLAVPFSAKRANCECLNFGVQSIADLAHLDDLGERKNNNLRAVNGSRGTDSVPGHLVFKDLQALHSEFWFQLVPIPTRQHMSRSTLRQTFDYRQFFAYLW